MSKRSRQSASVSDAQPASAIEHMPAMSAVALTALVVLNHLVPVDSSAREWNNVAAIMIWLLLLIGWGTSTLLSKRPTIVFDRVTVAVLILTLLPSVSALVVIATGSGNARLAMNLAWQWGAMGLLFFLARQWLKNSADARMLAAVMIALSVALASRGMLQHFYELPQKWVEYQANPDQFWLENFGAPIPPSNSPMRAHFEARLRDAAPTGTFALTNSLAGFIAPWLVLTGAIALAAMKRMEWQRGAYLALLVAILGLTLLITQSRTGLLATMIGLGLMAMFVSPLGRRVDGRLLFGVGSLAIVVTFIIALSGLVPWQSLGGAGKSVLVRVEYWQATTQLIRDNPLLGIGPGNFQDAYKLYQPAEASENIADPHNFFWEVGATSGLLGLAALMVVIGLFVREVTRRPPATIEAVKPPTLTAPLSTHLIGAIIGVLLAFVCGFLSGNSLAPELLLIGVPSALLTMWLLRDWIKQGELTLSLLLIPLATLAINLLAAGGISFPGVASSLWLLMAMSLVVVNEQHQTLAERPLARRGVWTCAIASVLVGLLYYSTVYSPVYRSAAAKSDAELAIRKHSLSEAKAHATNAAALDPASPSPWLQLAEIWHAYLIEEADAPTVRAEFQRTSEEALRRDPRSTSTRETLANLRLQLYRTVDSREDLLAARELQRGIVSRFPNNAFVHAQLAWTLHLLGEDEAARQEAEAALALDDRHHHEEFKLQNLVIVDFPPAPKLKAEQPADATNRNAEQLMRQLRTATASVPPKGSPP